MRKIGVFDAKTHFSALIDDVRQGESVEITRNGVPVAHLIPAPGTTRETGFARDDLWIADDFDSPLPDETVDAFYADSGAKPPRKRP